MKLNFIEFFICRNFIKYISAAWTYMNRFSEVWVNVGDKYINEIVLCFKNLYFLRLQILNDICVVDWIKSYNRFHIIYNFVSLLYSYRLYIIIFLKEHERLISLYWIFKNACWLEREVWDMFGIYILNSPDLRRILTDYGFEGYPLRKDFPLTGYLEVRYDDEKGNLVYEPVELSQEYRMFSFDSPWNYN